jgi:nucleoside-diphosphate-sugar epimerase
MSFKKVFVPGGAGYVGSVLVPALLEKGYEVSILDLFIYGEEPLEAVRDNPKLTLHRGDIRDTEAVKRATEGCDACIHLACISNDPSVELDPDLSRTVNYESFGPLIRMFKEGGGRRFVFASSGSVYGVSDSPDVTEEHPLVPVSLYNKYKAKCEPVLQAEKSAEFVPVIIRPATICGYSPRQRLDLTVNILTNLAVNKGQITVFGGTQMRPNLHMKDMVQLYLNMLEYEDDLINGQIFNAAYQNFSVAETAEIIRDVVAAEYPEREPIEIVTTPSDDVRSYHISSEKIRKVLGFEPQFTIEDASRDLIAAFRQGLLPNSQDDIKYFNIKMMKSRHVK